MKMNKFINAGVLFFTGLLLFTACEKKYSDEYNRYDPAPVTASNVNLDYHGALETYPLLQVFVSDTPSYTIEGQFFFAIDTAYSTTGSEFSSNKFGINSQTGVISYDNASGSIAPGNYAVDVSVVNLTGIAVVKPAFELKILEVPVNLTADPDNLNLTLADTGVISQLTYTVIGNPEPGITEVTYTIKPTVTGFSVNEAGEIRMNSEVESGEYWLSIMAKTNLGNKLFDDLVNVNVEGK